MNIRFLTFARQEIDEAYLWLEENSPGTGLEFLDALDRVVRLVVTFPLASPEILPGVRRCIFAHFPYSVLYAIDENTIVVLAVAHAHRHPEYWVRRIMDSA